ncbi:MAG: hypothetical protein KDD38_04310, partial [Bdellovibrionales bacterium]|nr:hypothetical protein [Bdellovibrionales bacterium]
WREWLKHGTQTVRANSCGRFQSSDNGNMMRSANARSEYGPFLHEQILVDLYRKNFHVITSYTPEGRISNFSHIDIEPMRPISHEFDVFWTANGKNITPVNSKSLVRSDLKGFSGLMTLQVKVVDPTTLVKSERFRDELMTKTLTWTVDLNESPAPELPTPPAPPTSPSPEPPAPPVTEPIFDPVGKFCSYKHWPHGGADSLQEELLYGDKVTRHLAGKESTEPCSAGAQGSKVYRTYFSQVITCKLNSTSSGVILAQISKNEITEEVENTCKIP